MIGMTTIIPLFSHRRMTEVTYFTTNACGFSCEHCFMKGKLNIPMEELTPDELTRMGAEVGPLQRVHLGGGEPMMRANIAEKAVIVANLWNAQVVCIPTNGWHTDTILHVIRRFGEQSSKLLRLHFSLNALGEEMDRFTGVQHSFTRWEESIRRALQCARSYGNIIITGLVTFGAYNRDRISDIKRYLLETIGVQDYSIQLARRHNDYDPGAPIGEFAREIRQYFQQESNQPPFLRAYRELVREKSAAYYRKPSCIARCRAGSARVVLSPDGDVYPCERLGYPNGMEPERWRMGNIRACDYSFRRLLRSPQASRIRREIAESFCHCESGIDLALNLACGTPFKLRVFFRGARYGVWKLFT